ncbi:MAG: hypothetical protein UT30_C0008G0018 [Candidatus Uhrbacteria bacterium GW2011_GWF2_39_13]|uniref:Capsular polysaccharide biosynthesis protein n=1 Tax=Candidatus Uhrbacteria bacterium GW2011_GWF2_39_13 TaxID=1618995 RepID=A0A0G0MVC7_9BACT|nr:MAG: hypothetical protein UT30_C0008G0018 [Candidatus Uhrbacteria bacterium GW2011_GWF2_39_13]
MGKNHEIFLEGFKRIYFYCCDPGAFYAAEPMYDDMTRQGKETVWIFDGWCREKKGKNLPFIDSKTFRSKAEKNKRDCVIICAQVNFKLNFQMIDFCKNQKLHTVFLFDYWGNYLNCFQDRDDLRLHLTDTIFIMDEIAKADLIKELSLFVDDNSFFENIIITEHRGIEKTVSLIRNMSEKIVQDFRGKLNPLNKKLVLLALEPLDEDLGCLKDGRPFLGFNEFSTVEYFFNDMNYRDARILIKPHPRHRNGIINSFISKHSQIHEFDYTIVENVDLSLLLSAIDEVVGMTSSVLVIALKCGKKIKSIQLKRNKNAVKLSNPYLTPYIIEK